MNALAFEKDGVFEIHTGNQWQSLVLPLLAKALGLGGAAHCLDAAVHLVVGDDRRFVHDDALAARVDARVRRAEVDGEIAREERENRAEAQRAAPCRRGGAPRSGVMGSV